MLRPDAKEVGPWRFVQHKCRAQVFLGVADSDVAHVTVLGVADEEAVIGHRRAKHAGFRISVFVFRRLEKGVLFRATTLMLDVDVVQPDVFNFVSRNAADNGSQARGRIRPNHVTDVDPPQFSYGYALGSAP